MRYQPPDGNVIEATQDFVDAHYPGAMLVVDAQPEPSPSRRLTKLEFIGRLGNEAFRAILEAARLSVDVEMFVRLLDYATPDPDGTSIDLDDPRTRAGIEMLVQAELISGAIATEVLA